MQQFVSLTAKQLMKELSNPEDAPAYHCPRPLVFTAKF